MTIEVRFTVQASNGLRVIDHIPPFRPCRLEGRNGIGKSVAVKLLMLASGKQPFVDASAWASLKNSIGDTKITLTGLNGAASAAELIFTPEKWPTTLSLEIGEWLGAVSIAGVPAAASDLFAILTVEHFVGTERLSESLEYHRTEASIALESVARRLNDQRDSLAEIQDFEALLWDLSPGSAGENALTIGTIESTLSEKNSALNALTSRGVKLKEALALKVAVGLSVQPNAEGKLESLRADLKKSSLEASGLEKRMNSLLKELEKGDAAQKEVAKLQRKRVALVRAREKQFTDIVNFAASAGLSEVIDGKQPAESVLQVVSGLHAEAATDLDRLEKVERLARLTDLERRLNDGLHVVLEEGISNGLHDYVVAQLGALEVKVEPLLTGLDAPRTVATASTASLKEARERESSLRAMINYYETVREHSEQLSEIAASLEKAETTQAGKSLTEDAIEGLRGEWEVVTERESAIRQEIGATQNAGFSGESLAQAVDDLASRLSDVGLAEDDLEEAFQLSLAGISALSSEIASLGRELAGLKEVLIKRRIDRELLGLRLREDDTVKWLARLVPIPPGDLRDADLFWAAIYRKVETAQKKLSALIDSVTQLAAVGSDLSSERWPARTMARYVETETMKNLSDVEVVNALFDGGRLERVDAISRSISWKTKDNERRSRPMSAFSSGEQALAFVRARLSRLATVDPLNRLIFLDEFGAFISADRRRPLASLISDSTSNTLSSQVIVILPLQADYAAELSSTTGDLHDTFLSRASEIEKHGYFAEKFFG